MYSVAFGTERGSLHYRKNYLSGRCISSRGGGPYNTTTNERGLQGGGGGDPSQLFIDPDTSTPVKGSIVGIVRAHPPHSPSSSSLSANYNNATPVFLLHIGR